MRWPWSKRTTLDVGTQRPRIHATCCGRTDFAVGTPTGSPWFDGETVGIDHKGPLICCAHCGKKYGMNESGLYEPHPDCLPPQWAVAEERRKAIEAEIRRRGNGGDDPRTLARRQPHGRPMARPRDTED